MDQKWWNLRVSEDVKEVQIKNALQSLGR